MGRYWIDRTFEDLELAAFKSCDLALQSDNLTIEYYYSQHKAAFWRHILLCGKVDYKQRDEILKIYESWEKQAKPTLDKSELIKITRPARQLFLSQIAADS